MSSDFSNLPEHPMIRLLDAAFTEFSSELHRRVAEAGYTDIRPGHGCVFGYIAPEGSRLTDLAERAGMTKQSVGEAASDLEKRGYLERVPDPNDGRAKIIRLTDRGREAQAIGRGLIADIEADWAERFGADRIAALRDALETVAAEQLRTAPPLPDPRRAVMA